MLSAFAGFHTFHDGYQTEGASHVRILHNTWINQYRKRQRRPDEVSVGHMTDQQLAGDVLHPTPSLRSAELAVLESLPDKEIVDALMTLRDELRIAIYLAHVEIPTRRLPASRILRLARSCRDCTAGQRLRTALRQVAAERGFATSRTRVDRRRHVIDAIFRNRARRRRLPETSSPECFRSVFGVGAKGRAMHIVTPPIDTSSISCSRRRTRSRRSGRVRTQGGLPDDGRGRRNQICVMRAVIPPGVTVPTQP
jgi:RNA polymerase sigma-70 factor (ECF subfamily)